MAALSGDSSVEWEAAQWVARRIDDEPFDEAGFDAWIAADPERKPLYDTMWRRFMGPRTDDALEALGQRRRSRRAWLAGGVAAVLAMFGAYRALPTFELITARPLEYASGEGAIREVRLADGSRLTLAGGASIRVRYTSHVRDVELMRGTLFADVRHDEARPFRVEAGGARIADLGTRFEVSKKAASVRVTVESGAVRFGPNGWFGERIDLLADQAAVLNDGGLSRADDVRRARIARWRSEWVEYDGAPLSEVVADLESVSPLPIRIVDDDLAGTRVSGRIRLTDPIGQIGNLSIIQGFAVDRRDGVLVLSRSRKKTL